VWPFDYQGRVFGFALTIENAASPLVTFMIGMIGLIAQIFVIPTMTDGTGADLIGGWFGAGADRGLALIFTLAGLIGIVATLLASRSRNNSRQSPVVRSLSTTVRPSVETWRSREERNPIIEPRINEAMRPMPPTTIRMIPMSRRSTPSASFFTAQVKTAPAAINNTLSAPMVHTFQLVR